MIPHLAIPFRVDSTGAAAVVDQDSFDEIAQCVRVLLTTRRGQRIELRDYGITNPVFSEQGSLDRTGMAAAVTKWEPRARAVLRSDPDRFDDLLLHVTAELDIENSARAGSG
jgi:phage baseplate assembly protein W